MLRRLLSTSASRLAPVATRAGAGGLPPPLKGVRILDLTRVLAGPYATMLLADLGASVIKIEHPTRGDDTRAWNPPSAPTIHHSSPPSASKQADEAAGLRAENWNELAPESAYFLSVNRNKKSVGVNLKHPEGLALVHELIRKADVLVENYVPGKLEELGLSYEVCEKLNPKLIYASITGSYLSPSCRLSTDEGRRIRTDGPVC